jgi:pyruvate dehydrogenase E1 component beta subunit
MSAREYSGRDALNRALDRALATDERVLLLGEDLADPVGGRYGVTRGLSTTHGRHRVVNLPASATALTGAAVGAALEGMVPVVELPVAALTGAALGQLAQTAVLGDLRGRTATCGSPVFRVPVPADPALPLAEPAFQPEHWFALVPGLTIVAPSTPADAGALLTSAILDPAPCVILESVSLYRTRGPLTEHAGTDPGLGVAAVIRRGRDATVVTYGASRAAALCAADDLAVDGVEIDVVDLRTLAPLDVGTILTRVRHTRRLVLAPNVAGPYGPGAAIAAQVGRELFGELEVPVEHSACGDGTGRAAIAAAVRGVCKGGTRSA